MASNKRPDQQQVPDVGAGDEQDQGDYAHHHLERGQHFAGMVEGGLPQRPQPDVAPSVSGWIALLQSCSDARNLLLRLGSSNAGLQAHIRFDPSRTPVLELITSASKSFLHRCRDPELDRTAYKGSIESLGRDADDGMRHIV